MDGISEHFLATYEKYIRPGAGDAALLRSRVAAYEIICLIRMALHGWQKLKGERMLYALQLTEERIACLTQVH